MHGVLYLSKVDSSHLCLKRMVLLQLALGGVVRRITLFNTHANNTLQHHDRHTQSIPFPGHSTHWQVGWIFVRVVCSRLHLLPHPHLCLVCLTFKLLQRVGLPQFVSPRHQSRLETRPLRQDTGPPLCNLHCSIVSVLYQSICKCLQCSYLLLL